jgi:exonuclease SbcC
MRPLVLELQAFGPFAGHERIDFGELGEHPLFLINGPTGAGKTSILDAICFALYGDTTGNRREGTEMRSNHAAQDVATWVRLDFALGDKHYRILRKPEQMRPKERGEGMTTQKPEATLHKLGDDGEEATGELLVPNKVSEANSRIEQLLGLKSEQFRQVMVLPQGRFIELLEADSRQREDIFAELFQTGIYKKLEDKLKDAARDVSNALRSKRENETGILQSAGVESREQLQEELQSLQAPIEEQRTQTEVAQKQLNKQRQALASASQIKAQFERLQKAETSIASLEALAESIKEQDQKLERARRADQLNPVYQQLQQTESSCKKAQSQVEDLQAQQQQKAQTLANAVEALAANQALATAIETDKQQLHTLLGYQEKAAALETLLAEQSLQQQLLNKQQNDLQKNRQSLDALKSEEKAIQTRCQQLQETSQKLAEKELQLNNLQEIIKKCEKLQKFKQRMRQLQETLRASDANVAHQHQALSAAKQQYDVLQLSWHQGQAAILAQRLETDTPCPVCGSAEHPAPAQSSSALPSEAELERAQTQVEQQQLLFNNAESEQRDCRNSISSGEEHISLLRDELGDHADSDMTSLHQQLLTLQQDCDASLKAGLQLAEEQTQLQKTGTQIQETDTLLQQAEQLFRDGERAAMRADSEVASAQQALPEAYRSQGALQQAIQSCEQKIASQQQALEQATREEFQARRALELGQNTIDNASNLLLENQTQLQQQQDDWQSTLQASAFDSDEAFVDARLTADEQQQLSDAIDSHQRSLEEARISARELRTSLGDTTVPDVETLQQQLSAQSEQFSQIQSALQSLLSRQHQLQQANETLKKTDRSAAKLEDEYAIVGTLAEAVGGNNSQRLSLQRYVLGVLLDDVLLQATTRLLQMSSGRFQLRRKGERSKGNRASGLDLEVFDDYTGLARSVATLSGGESFMAALSLALGLSDVVQSYAGGIRLDTLFIDEGFGSLDSEALELAIRTLTDLQAAGRMVGVISHVSELKEQMPLRIDITKRNDGSHLTLRT